ncbi:MAG: GDP-mannose 4,6-dehydratase, partial [Anaerolineales bacterium]|nr:GDP-mannose 4,6-dehydratase [Anaerolineales bacterium]
NFMITLNLLMACREMGMARLVVACSNAVLFTASRERVVDVEFFESQSPFSATEYGVEQLVKSFYSEYRLPVVTVRLFNTFGARQPGRAVIPSIISQALAGNTIHLRNADTEHDFTYISDTERGFLLAGSAVGVEGGVFDLGTGNEIRLGDLAERIALKVSRKVEIIIEPQSLAPAISSGVQPVSETPLARTALGWEPQVSMDEGLDKTIAWMRLHMDLYPPGQYEF